MSIDFLRSTTTSSSAFRVICGEMVLDKKWNVHSEVLLGYVKSGKLMIETATNAYNLHPGDIYFISPNFRYRISSHINAAVDVILLNLSNPAAVTQEYIPQSLIRGLTTGNSTHIAKVTPDMTFYPSLLEDFKTIKRAETDKGEFYQLLVHGKMYNLFYTLFSNGVIKIVEAETQGKKYRALHRITEYINENFCESISLDTVALTTGLSRYYVSHLFKELMNTTFVNYVNELRLTRAAMLLTTTDTPVIEVAGMSGFNNISNFNRAFKLYYDTTPSKYRKFERQIY